VTWGSALKIAIIAALTANRVIGRGGSIPWRHPADQRRFARITLGHPCIMGRKTFESLPRPPLAGRLNLVLTRQQDYAVPQGAQVCGGLDEAITCSEESGATIGFVLGGAQVYRQALSVADEMLLTHVPDQVQGDILFPEWSTEEWEIVDTQRDGALRYVTYRRRDRRLSEIQGRGRLAAGQALHLLG